MGRRLALARQLPCYDTDVLIGEQAGKTIKEWVEEKGWESFRQIEKAVIRKISSWPPGVIALGGGAVLDAENRVIIKENGLVVWLKADVQTILKRMRSDSLTEGQRPPLSAEDQETEIRETLAARTPLYQALADIQIDTQGKTIEDIIEEIGGIEGFEGSRIQMKSGEV